jgi:hypothetical protein
MALPIRQSSSLYKNLYTFILFFLIFQKYCNLGYYYHYLNIFLVTKFYFLCYFCYRSLVKNLRIFLENYLIDKDGCSMKKLLQILSVLLFAIAFISSFARAIENDEVSIRKNLPKLLGSSNQGTEFFMTFHPCWETTGAGDGCKIYVTSAVATRVTVEIPGKEIFQQKTTIPNDIIEFTLDPSIAQCYRKTDAQPPQPQQVYKGYGIIVTSDDPIICYGMTRYQSTSDGYLAIPVNGLGKNYIVSSYNDPCQDNGYQYLTSYTSIVGAYNKTNVTVQLGGRMSNYTPGANPIKFGDVCKNTLDRGDVWLIGAMGDYNDLTGTTVRTNKPVSVISGSFCAFVPLQLSACDFLIEQDLPMETWGYTYHVTRIIERLKGSIIRIFASEPNTVIYRDGSEWSLIKSVGGAEGSGFIERRAVAETEELRPITISAKNRIAVTQYNCSISDDGKSSDPFQMALMPIEQYQNSLIFPTPGINGGSYFKQNYLNLCYKATEAGKTPEDIEFGKVSNGVINWRKLNTVVGNAGQEFVDLTSTDSRNYRALTITLEDPAGVYALRGNDPMMGYLYGFDWCDSYGFPASGLYNDLSKPDIWAPLATYTIDCVVDEPLNDEKLRSNLSALRLVKGESYNFSNLIYNEADFIPGETYSANWNLNVIDQEADGRAVLLFSDRAGNDTTITIDYNRIKLSINNRVENWGLKRIFDPPETKEFTLLNESADPVIVDSILLLSTIKDRNWSYNGFKIDSSIYKEYGGVLPGYTMQPGAELSFKVSFDPQSVASEILIGRSQFLDSIGINANWSNDVKTYCYFKYKSAVKAATGSPCISVNNLDFGQKIIGNSVTKSFSITNNGTSNLNITGYTLPAGDVAGIYKTNLGKIDANNPLVIIDGETKNFNVTFKPNALGILPDKIVFKSDADTICFDLKPTLELTGEGIALTISQLPNLYIDENTFGNIAISSNYDNSDALKFTKESDDETLISKDSMFVTGSGKNYNLKIIPMRDKIGTCNVTISATNGLAKADSKLKVVVSKPGFVEDKTIAGNDITITPNPVKTNFSISSQTLIIQEVAIYDISGAVVLKTENLRNIDISNFTTGTYYCVVKSNGNSYSKKFEIVR